jgi:hypothetical protein
MADSEATEPRHRGLIPWKPGESGNPHGRPKGSRNKLGEAFIEAMHKDFQEHGVSVIEAVRVEKPDQYLKVIASILPKELNVKVDPLDDMTDEQLNHRIRQLAAALQLSIDGGAGEASGSQEAKTRH